jgi:recombination protein RecT
MFKRRRGVEQMTLAVIQKVEGHILNKLDVIQKDCPVAVTGLLTDVKMVIADNVKLQKCTPASIVKCILTAARLGLSLDPNINHAYLIPYGDQCKIEISYIGLADIIYKENGIIIDARIVRVDDDFEVVNGKVNHKYNPFSKADIIGYYATGRYPDGRLQTEFMNLDDIAKVRSKSKGGNVWNEWEEEMGKKSVIRRLSKHLPKTGNSGKVIEFDNKKAVGEQDYIDIEGVEIVDEKRTCKAEQ